MAAQKSIAKGARTHRAVPKPQAAVRPRRASKPRSSAKSPVRPPKPKPRSQRRSRRPDRRGDLLEMLSARLALVETASMALQRFEDNADIGPICASLEHAVRMLATAH